MGQFLKVMKYPQFSLGLQPHCIFLGKEIFRADKVFLSMAPHSGRASGVVI